jgi:hypothetical protein
LSEVVYLYGFVPASAEQPAPGLTGIAGRPVELAATADFAAAFSRVPSSAYEPAAIEPRLEDLGWVAEQGLAHERVVAWFVDYAQIVPVPLFTLYTSVESMLASAQARSEEIRDQIRRFDGLREWDLKVSYRADEIVRHAGELSSEVRDLDTKIVESTPGRRFLLERMRTDLVRDTAGRLARARAFALLEQIRNRAQDAVVLPLPRADRELPVVLHAALLVGSGEEMGLAEEVARQAATLDAVGVSVQFSGPWAPYRFLDRHAQ